MWYELLGYTASILVAVSLTMKSIVRLRLVNLVGAICFTIYGLLIHAYPVAAVNGVIVLINLYHLREMARRSEYFQLLEVPTDSGYMAAFLAFHARDIARFLPSFDPAPRPGQLSFFVLRDMIPAGLFLGVPAGDGVLEVALDYVIPGYRDLKVGEFVFRENAKALTSRGIRALRSPAGSPDHEAYLTRMGFAKVGADSYRLDLASQA